MRKLVSKIGLLPTASFIICSAALFALACFALGQMTRTLRTLFPYQALRFGTIIFPSDLPFLAGVAVLFVLYEVFSRSISKSERNYRSKRVLSFLAFALSFKFFFLTPLSLPRPSELLPLKISGTKCSIYSKLDSEVARVDLELCESFFNLLSTEFFGRDFSAHSSILLFASKEQYQQAVGSLGIGGSTMGIYIPSVKAVFTHPGTGLGTLTHELTHAFIDSNGLHFPRWAREGVPVFFEKFFGSRSGADLRLRFGFVNSWRYQELAPMIDHLTVDMIDTGNRSESESIDGLLSYFLWYEGKFITFLRAGLDASNSAPNIAALFSGKEELESAWIRFREYLQSNQERWLATPASAILASEDEVSAAAARYGLNR